MHKIALPKSPTHFVPIRDEHERTLKAHPDLASYFQKKVGDNITDIDMTTRVPKVAADAVETELNADEAMVLVQEVGTQRRYVEAARRTVGKLRNALATDMRLDMFPAMRRNYLTANEFLNRSLLAGARLNQIVGAGIDNAQYQSLRERRRSLGELFRRTPISANDFKSRRAEMKGKLRALDMQVNQLGAELTSVDAQLTALNQFQRANPDRAAARGIEKEVEQAQLLRKRLRELVWSLEDERSKLGLEIMQRSKIRRFDLHFAVPYLRKRACFVAQT